MEGIVPNWATSTRYNALEIQTSSLTTDVDINEQVDGNDEEH
jgi:hypothetical protein